MNKRKFQKVVRHVFRGLDHGRIQSSKTTPFCHQVSTLAQMSLIQLICTLAQRFRYHNLNNYQSNMSAQTRTNAALPNQQTVETLLAFDDIKSMIHAALDVLVCDLPSTR